MHFYARTEGRFGAPLSFQCCLEIVGANLVLSLQAHGNFQFKIYKRGFSASVTLFRQTVDKNGGAPRIVGAGEGKGSKAVGDTNQDRPHGASGRLRLEKRAPRRFEKGWHLEGGRTNEPAMKLSVKKSENQAHFDEELKGQVEKGCSSAWICGDARAASPTATLKTCQEKAGGGPEGRSHIALWRESKEARRKKREEAQVR